MKATSLIPSAAPLSTLTVDHQDAAAASPIIEACLRRVPSGAARHVAVAHGRLDVMGGLTEHTGGLCIVTPLELRCCGVAQLRGDAKFVIFPCIPEVADPQEPAILSAEELALPARPIRAEDSSVAGFINAERSFSLAQATLAAAYAEGWIPRGQGMSLAFGDELSSVPDSGGEAAVVASVLGAIRGALGLRRPNPESSEDVAFFDRVFRSSVGRFSLAAEFACAAAARPGAFLRRSDAGSPRYLPISWPDDWGILAVIIVSPFRPSVDALQSAWTASLMGTILADRIATHAGLGSDRWNGMLSGLSISDYVDHVRDRLPTRIRGDEFLFQYPESLGGVIEVDPSLEYRIRSRSEHHVYESARTREFLSFARRPSTSPAQWNKIGKMMFASHWSYGQRCGLNNAPADALVGALRRTDPDGGVFGARVSGRGEQGLVAIFHRNDESSRLHIQSCLDLFQRETGLKARIVEASRTRERATPPFAV